MRISRSQKYALIGSDVFGSALLVALSWAGLFFARARRVWGRQMGLFRVDFCFTLQPSPHVQACPVCFMSIWDIPLTCFFFLSPKRMSSVSSLCVFAGWRRLINASVFPPLFIQVHICTTGLIVTPPPSSPVTTATVFTFPPETSYASIPVVSSGAFVFCMHVSR